MRTILFITKTKSYNFKESIYVDLNITNTVLSTSEPFNRSAFPPDFHAFLNIDNIENSAFPLNFNS